LVIEATNTMSKLISSSYINIIQSPIWTPHKKMALFIV
jgi:hypothetical protein